jgi:integrase
MASIEKRPTENGTPHYRVRVRLKGHPAQTASFASLTEARQWAQSVESAMREGRHLQTIEAHKHTLAELIDRYMTSVLPGKRDQANPARQLAWWREEIGYLLLVNITPALLAEKRDKLLSGDRTPATTVRYLAALSSAFTVAVKEWQWCESNPLERVTKPKEPRGRTRFLDEDERARLLEACRVSDCPVLHAIVVVALSSGMRRSEIMNLYWREPATPRNPLGAWFTWSKEGSSYTKPRMAKFGMSPWSGRHWTH